MTPLMDSKLGKHSPIAYETNPLGQPIGQAVEWAGAQSPNKVTLHGEHAHLYPLDTEQHALALHTELQQDPTGALWTYLPYGPFSTFNNYHRWLTQFCNNQDPLFFCLATPEGQPKGVFALAAIEPEKGSIELAHVLFSPAMQKTPLATQAVYLVLRYVFELGYRRCEWKCNALNMGSKKAALRFGFSYEGLFRNAMVAKHHNRDTAWFGMTDTDWQQLQPAFERWLQADNFDANGQQKIALGLLTEPVRRQLNSDPLGTNNDAGTL